ncbi:hypothetical protein [Microbacterium kyungheense]|uniref:Lipoprotein n=1 Tax=Microbacterium kyungheense TaxID=1263636 RepID=A0A543FKR0_9MICO|nr:hypothetical protein [Microbacterium kyungheense]TQM34286.1 hypothetical protein FB391_0573 [Microbacterium kyungheense]
MRSRSTAVLSLLAVSGLLLAGCASTPSSDATPEKTTPAVSVVDSSITDPAAVGERVGADGLQLEVWSGIVPDEAAAGALGDPDEGTQWVTANVAQWVSDKGLTGADVAPVLRSTADDSFEGVAVPQQNVDVEMKPDTSYTYVWSYAVPEALVDPSTLVICVGDGDEGCSTLTK